MDELDVCCLNCLDQARAASNGSTANDANGSDADDGSYDGDAKTGWDGAVVAVLGLFDKGKTFVLNRLAEIDLPSGKKVSTKGLSFKHVDVEGTKFVVLDSEGSYSPVRVVDEIARIAGQLVTEKQAASLLRAAFESGSAALTSTVAEFEVRDDIDLAELCTPEMIEMFRRQTQDARQVAGNTDADADQRAAAIRWLATEIVEKLNVDEIGSLIRSNSPPAVQKAAVEALGSHENVPKVMSHLITAWSSGTPALRAHIFEFVSNQPEMSNLFLKAVEENRIEVTATGDDTALAGIQRLVTEAQNSSSRAQRLADRAAALLFWFALGSAVITAVAWTLIGDADSAVIRSITVLVIACPHALGLAIPLVVSIATERAARAGVLVKDRLALESMRTVDTVLFDKTGTLTEGSPAVTAVAAVGVSDDEVLALAAAAENASEHPLGAAIVRAATERGIHVPEASDFSSAPAVGVTATVDGREIRVGGPRMLEQLGASEVGAAASWRDEGAIILHVARDGVVIGGLALADRVRQESREAVDALRTLGIGVVMITGDAHSVATAVGDELGIDRVFAEVRPEDKAAAVRELQREGKRVAMVGDGVNDAPALAQAEVGIAIGAGTDVAIASAGVILATSDPRSVLSVIELSRRTYRKMTQNLWWAGGYNLISVPLAAGILAPIGFVLPMSVGAILMSLSTVVVALNAQLLRRIDLDPASAVRAALRR